MTGYPQCTDTLAIRFLVFLNLGCLATAGVLAWLPVGRLAWPALGLAWLVFTGIAARMSADRGISKMAQVVADTQSLEPLRERIRDWLTERARLSDAEEAAMGEEGGPPAGDFHDSDDAAVDIVHEVADLLEVTSASGDESTAGTGLSS